MSSIRFSGLRPSRKTRRLLALIALVVLCLTIATVFAGAAFAAAEKVQIQTSEGMEAPELDYQFVWWSFLITFGLLAVYYVLILRASDTEFKKIVDAHFGPKQDGR